MFSGIVEKTGKVVAVGEKFKLKSEWPDVVVGESIAVNGVCLTTTLAGGLEFDLGPETLARTNLGKLKVGDAVNLERSLRASDRLSGHWVQGHVDCVAKITSLRAENDSWWVGVEIPQFNQQPDPILYCVNKGSITIDGISLTIAQMNALKKEREILFQIIPHTWQLTNLSQRSIDDQVNVEFDILGKYVVNAFTSYKQSLV